jgi:ubiquitin-activating enzyme E1
MKIEEEKEGGQKEALSGAAEAADSANEDDKKVELFQGALQKLDVAQIEKLQPVEFEKDDDSNFHMDFITAVANLRATNYSIEPTTKHVAKGIAGKIIPAMVTTTSVVSGLVCIELLKLIQAADPKAGPDAPGKKLEAFSNGFLNLAIPFTGFSDPIAAPSFEIREGWSWTLWDRLDVEVDGKELTLQEFIDWFSSKHQLEVSMISHGTSLLYSSFMAAEKRKERLPAPLSEVIASVTKNPLPEGEIWTHLECIVCREEDDEDVDIPSVRYRYSYN